MPDYITTYGGTHFVPAKPEMDKIHITDIAHALSLICRGSGHVKTFFSVGQHCIHCALEAEARGYSRRIVLACLLHDASEAYISDVPSPFKKIDDDMLYFDLRDLLGDPDDRQEPAVKTVISHQVVPFEEVERRYLELFYRYKA